MAKPPKIPKVKYKVPDAKDEEEARERERLRRSKRQGAASTILSGRTDRQTRSNIGAATLGGY